MDCNSVTRAWRVYGADGHRQAESFRPSWQADWSRPGNTRKIAVLNSDMTQTNDYSIVVITMNSAMECANELDGQISDGIFENCRVGRVVETAVPDCSAVPCFVH